MEFAQGANFGCYTARLFLRTAKGTASPRKRSSTRSVLWIKFSSPACIYFIYRACISAALAFCMPRDYKRAENCQEFNILISDVTNSIPAAPITSLIVERKRVKKRKDWKIWPNVCRVYLSLFIIWLFYFWRSFSAKCTSHMFNADSRMQRLMIDSFHATQWGSSRVTSLKFLLMSNQLSSRKSFRYT